MISVFVYSSDPNDFPNWRWQIETGINAPADTHPECLDTGTVVYERRSPTPSIILPYNTRAVSLFNESLPNTEEVTADHVSGMERFISSLREIIGNCQSVAAFRNDPLCVFIHFGGDIYEDANSNFDRYCTEAFVTGEITIDEFIAKCQTMLVNAREAR